MATRVAPERLPLWYRKLLGHPVKVCFHTPHNNNSTQEITITLAVNALSVGQRGPKPNESLATREAWTEDPMEGEWPRKRWLASLVL
jgi:hypothetical protein